LPALDPLLISSVRRGNVLPLGSGCNLSCLFCSNRFNPFGVQARSLPPLTVDEARALIPLLDPCQKVVIGESATRIVEGEPLLHPRLLDILHLVRDALPGTPLQITTNGLRLESPLQRELAKLGPIELIISVNALDPDLRRRCLADLEPEKTLDQLSALKENGLLFQASFVLAPPFLGEFPAALGQMERWGANYLRLLLPGGSHLAPPELQGSWQAWLDLRQQVRHWRTATRIPCVLEPPILLDLRAEVEGVLPCSPADKAGLTASDVIEMVEGKQPFSRQDAYLRILSLASPKLMVSRDGTTRETCLEKKAGASSGLVFLRDLRKSSLERCLGQLPSQGRGLALTGELAAPVLNLAWEALGISLPLRAVPNRTFGGSIRAAGLLTLEDFRAGLQEATNQGIGWDWLLLPAAPFEDGVDLLGESLAVFEEEVRCPVFLAES
jgi:NifB/MoaA-like Fe-S oxidoreductase